MRQLNVFGLLMFVALAGFENGYSNPAAALQPSTKPKVVATFSVLGDLVQNVSGDKVELVTLVGPDGDAHTFMPKPGDGKAITNAVAIFEIGVGFEPWLGGLYSSTGSKAKRMVVSKGLTLLEGSDAEHDKKDAKAKDEDKDPHVWHDVKNTIRIVGSIRDHLVKVDSANAEHYKNSAMAYLKKLEDLDKWVIKEVNSLPKERRKLVTNHDTFGYFAKRYGFEIIGDALGSASTEAQEPSAKEFANLVKKIKAANVPVIFAENIESSKLMKRLAAEANVRLGPELFTDALGKAGTPGETYEKMMHYNVTSIVTELKK